MVWSEGNVSLKNPVTPAGIDPGTVRLVAQRNIIEELNLQQTAARTSSVTTGQESEGLTAVTYSCADK